MTARSTAMSMHSLYFFTGHATGPVLHGIGIGTLGALSAVLIGGLVVMLIGLLCAHYLRRRPA